MPEVMELEPGSYWWCQCGLSKTQPFCDGSHAGTQFEPIELKIESRKRVALCKCKQTAKAPFCDGTHSRPLAPISTRTNRGIYEGVTSFLLPRHLAETVPFRFLSESISLDELTTSVQLD